MLRECNNQQQLRMLTVCAIMTPPPPSRTTGQFTHGQFARKPGDPRGPRTSRNPSINAPCMEVTTAPSMSIISINAGVPVCAPCAASSVCTAHVNLDSDIIGESRHKVGGHTQCNNTRSVTVAGMLHSVVPDDCKTDHTAACVLAHNESKCNNMVLSSHSLPLSLLSPPLPGDLPGRGGIYLACIKIGCAVPATPSCSAAGFFLKFPLASGWSLALALRRLRPT